MEEKTTTVKTAKERLDELDRVLDEYGASKGVVKGEVPEDSTKYLQLSKEELRGMSAEDCGEAAYLLSQLALYLKREENREISRLNWLESQMNKSLANLTGQFDKFTPYEERKNKAIQGDTYVTKLNELRVYVKARTDRLSGLSINVQGMVKTMLELQQSKRGNK